jgi:hypothetical protein
MDDFHFFKFDECQIRLRPSAVDPIEGYEEAKDFPNCCNWHKSIYEASIEFYDRFPNCCEEHKKFIKTFNVDKTDYENIKIDIVKRLSYTEYFIEARINNEDWYEDIIHWFNYIEKSFGQPEVGLQLYLQNLELHIENNKLIPDEKKARLLKYFEDLYKPSAKANDSDLHILIITYQNWLKLFPFELSIFKNIKQHFVKTLPFVKGKTDYNPYTGLTSFKPVNQTELLENLVNITKNILVQVDTSLIIEKNLNDQANIHNLEILNKLHRTKQETLLKDFNKSETKYIKTIKKWLENEKEYFVNIIPIINSKALPEAKKISPPKFFKLNGLSNILKEKATDLHNSLFLKKYLDEESKKDFIKLFTAQQPQNKILWLGLKGELKSFIDFLISTNKIENCNDYKWQITAANFKFPDGDFKSNTIKDTKKVKNDIKIKQIVQTIK